MIKELKDALDRELDAALESGDARLTVTTAGISAALARSRERRASEITNAPVEVVTHITAGETR